MYCLIRLKIVLYSEMNSVLLMCEWLSKISKIVGDGIVII